MWPPVPNYVSSAHVLDLPLARLRFDFTEAHAELTVRVKVRDRVRVRARARVGVTIRVWNEESAALLYEQSPKWAAT